jgi:hypothetical protein
MVEQKSLLDAKTAAQTAMEYLRDMLPGVKEIMLEEVEKTGQGDRDCWAITLSFHSRDLMEQYVAMAMEQRRYKTFMVDAESGEVISMKIRTL